jgi:GntR family transcriptional regulator/MocR family aminotransferase
MSGACARATARRDKLVRMLAERAPAVTPSGAAAGLRVLLDLPPEGPAAAELCDRASAQSVQLYRVEGRNAVLVGYGALSEHETDAGLKACATSSPSRTDG